MLFKSILLLISIAQANAELKPVLDFQAVLTNSGPASYQDVYQRVTTSLANSNGVNKRREVRRAKARRFLEDFYPVYIYEIHRLANQFRVPAEAVLGALLIEQIISHNYIDVMQGWATRIVPKNYKPYAKKVSLCDSGALGDDCLRCSSLAFAERFSCYNKFIGEIGFPFGTNSDGGSYGPAQFKLIPLLSVADRPFIYGRAGLFSRPMPTSLEDLIKDLESAVQTDLGSIYFMAATMNLAIDYYARSGWNISQAPSILISLFRIGKIPERAKNSSMRTDPPRAELYGLYYYLIREQVDWLIQRRGRLSDDEITYLVQSLP